MSRAEVDSDTLANCLCELFGATSDNAWAGAKVLGETLLMYRSQFKRK